MTRFIVAQAITSVGCGSHIAHINWTYRRAQIHAPAKSKRMHQPNPDSHTSQVQTHAPAKLKHMHQLSPDTCTSRGLYAEGQPHAAPCRLTQKGSPTQASGSSHIYHSHALVDISQHTERPHAPIRAQDLQVQIVHQQGHHIGHRGVVHIHEGDDQRCQAGDFNCVHLLCTLFTVGGFLDDLGECVRVRVCVS